MKIYPIRLEIGVSSDCTDHIWFHCPDCKKEMVVQNVEQTRVTGTKCTLVRVFCKKCKLVGVRKFYWDYDKIGDASDDLHNPVSTTVNQLLPDV